MEGLDAQLTRLKALTDDLQRQMADANAAKSRLAAENFELVRVNQEYESQVVTFSKTKAALESQLDDMKRAMDEDARVG